MGYRIVLLLASLAVMTSALAKKKYRPPDRALDGHLRYRDCRFEKDPEEVMVWPALCVQAKTSGQVLTRLDTGKESKGLNIAQLYFGAYAQSWLSAHGQFRVRRYFNLSNSEERDVLRHDEIADKAFLQLGNVGINRPRLSLGRLPMAFGVDFRPLLESYDLLFKNNSYWYGPRYGARLAFDSQISSQYELSYATDRLNEDIAVERKGLESSNEAISLRTMFDIAALDGFRFIISAYGDRNGERRGGAGLVNVSRKGDETVFEWIRKRHTPSGLEQRYDQIFRLAYRSAFRAKARWVIEFEDELDQYRQGTLGTDLEMPDYGLFRLSVTYHMAVAERFDDFWMIGTAIQLAL